MIKLLSPIQKNQLAILRYFTKICDYHNLNYYLAEGTLLGAIRNGGFIPWDDDVDVCMPRKDYDTLVANAKEWIKDPFYIRHYDDLNDNNVRDIRIQMCDKRYPTIMNYSAEDEKVDLMIDILPIDAIPQNIFSQKFILLIHLLLLKLGKISQVNILRRDRFKSPIKILAFDIFRLLHFDKMNTNKILKLNEDFLRKRKPIHKGMVFISLSEYYRKTIFPNDYFGNGRRIIFEDIECSIPEKAEIILQSEYGNYMALPPECERVSKHNIKLYSGEM